MNDNINYYQTSEDTIAIHAGQENCDPATGAENLSAVLCHLYPHKKARTQPQGQP